MLSRSFVLFAVLFVCSLNGCQCDQSVNAGQLCDALTCPDGCCSGSACLSGQRTNACGLAGQACTDCSLRGEVCELQHCAIMTPGSGGGSGGGAATGGGGAATGGGGAATGGGDAATGGGDAATGGGTAAVDGGIGESCDDAPLLAPGAYTFSTQGTSNQVAPLAGTPGCSGLTPGPDRVFQVAVGPGMRVRARVTPVVNAPKFNPAVYLVEGCVGITRCLASSDLGDDAIEQVGWTNLDTTPHTVFVVVDSQLTSSSGGQTPFGSFTLLLEVVEGDVCETAERLALPVDLNLTNVGYSNQYEGGPTTAHWCGSTESADRVFAMDVPPGHRLTADVDASNHGGAAWILGPASQCQPRANTCAAGGRSNYSTDVERLTWFNDSSASARGFLVVDADGQYRLTADVDVPLSGDVCAKAEVLPLSSSFTSSWQNMRADYGDDADRVWFVDVPANTQLRVQLTAGYAPGVFFARSVADCELQSWANSSTGGDTDLTWINSGPATQRIYVVISSFIPNPNTLSIQASLGPIPAGDLCSSALPLATGASLVSQTTVGFTTDYEFDPASYLCPSGPRGNDRAYAVRVPAGQRGVVTSITDFTDLTLLPSVAACLPVVSQCLNTTIRGLHSVSWINDGVATADIIALVGTREPAFDLSYQVVPVLPGDRCEQPLTLGPGTTAHTLTGRYSDRPFDSAGGCTAADGPDEVFRVEIPAGMRATVSADPDLLRDVRMNLIPDSPAYCRRDIHQCIDGAVEFDGSPVTLAWENRGLTPTSILVVVSTLAERSFSTTDFDVTIALTPVAQVTPGERCETATLITAGALASQAIAGFTRDYIWGFSGVSTDCAGATGGSYAERVYAIDVPAGQTLRAKMLGQGVVGAVNLVAGPATNCHAYTTCLAGVAPNSDASYRNATASTQRLFIVVQASAAFDLITSLQ